MSSVDVVVPCYRYGHFLKECVQSVLAQQSVDVRVLIIDDASPDNTSETASGLAGEDARVSFFRHAQNIGHIATYNEGIDWAEGDYFLLLSADDFLLPGALSRVTHVMDERPEVGFGFGRAKALYERASVSKKGLAIESSDEAAWCILRGREFIERSGAQCIVAAPTAVVRTELQKRLGGYRPELPHSGDMEMWLRLAAHASVAALESYQAVYRVHDANMTLDYSQAGWLPDLRQRKAALECFFETCRDVLPDEQRLRRRLFHSLGIAAIGFSSTAFNDRQEEISTNLSDFALEVWPAIRWSIAWKRLAFKRRLGQRGWRALQPTVSRIRQFLARSEH